MSECPHCGTMTDERWIDPRAPSDEARWVCQECYVALAELCDTINEHEQPA